MTLDLSTTLNYLEEGAPLVEVLLCPPVAQLPDFPTFGVPDIAAATAQFAVLEQTLSSRGIRTHVLEPDLTLPMQCFVRDAGLSTPFGLIRLELDLALRRAEPDRLCQFARARGMPVIDLDLPGPLEGGDLCIFRSGLLIIGQNGGRSDAGSARCLAGFFQKHGWKTRILRYPPEFVHLDLLFTVIGPRHVLCATECFDAADLEWLLAQGVEILPVSPTEGGILACNAVALDDGVVLSNSGAECANRLMRAKGFEVVAPNLSAFIEDGGAAHCLTLRWAGGAPEPSPAVCHDSTLGTK